MDIEDLYFGVKVYDSDTDEIKTTNLFNSMRVMRSVATYVVKPESVGLSYLDRLWFLFGDTCGKFEWEFAVGGLFDEETEKTDVFKMYVEPNGELLLDMVSKVTEASAKRWLKEHK